MTLCFYTCQRISSCVHMAVFHNFILLTEAYWAWISNFEIWKSDWQCWCLFTSLKLFLLHSHHIQDSICATTLMGVLFFLRDKQPFICKRLSLKINLDCSLHEGSILRTCSRITQTGLIFILLGREIMVHFNMFLVYFCGRIKHVTWHSEYTHQKLRTTQILHEHDWQWEWVIEFVLTRLCTVFQLYHRELS